jgi:nifR3 family TIM-barrel protein
MLRIGPITAPTPVVLAPMAGITNAPFRTLCRDYGGGLYVSEMITSRGLVEGDDKTLRLVSFGPTERPRSLQLYGVDPQAVGAAVRRVIAEDLADHIDLNFGCPVPKVTRRGGGAALPYKRVLFRDIVRAAVRAAGGPGGPVPVTVKMRLGIDDAHLTYLQAGCAAQDEGAAAVALHARTAAQHYSGSADWLAIARLKAALTIPVLGNGDIWSSADALRMVSETGCDGVVVGRGCLGRPWLFRSLDRAFAGLPDDPPPTLGEVADTLRRHAGLLADWGGQDWACRDIRKHVAWYLKGFAVGPVLRSALGLVASLAELDDLLARLDHDQPFPPAELTAPRGRLGSPRRVALPAGWLDDPDTGGVQPGGTDAYEDDLVVSGG